MIQEDLNKYMDKCGIEVLPRQWQRLIRRLYGSYPIDCMPSGVCDPVYICNVIAVELNLGDGKGNFK